MSKNKQGKIIKRNLVAWLITLGGGAIFVLLTPGLPFGLRFGLWVTVAVCFVLTVMNPRWLVSVIKSIIGLLNAHWKLLVIMIFIVVVTAFISQKIFGSYDPTPDSVKVARQKVAKINWLSGKSTAWWAANSLLSKPIRRLFISEFTLIIEENLEVQGNESRTYVEDGRRIASEIRDSQGYSRMYYDTDGRNFATDYYNGSRTWTHLEIYDLRDKEKPPKIVWSFGYPPYPSYPVFIPFVPGFSYP